MYLMGFVNSTFLTRRPTGNLELVDLSLEKKYHPPEQMESRLKELGNHLGDSHLQNGSTMTVSYGNGNGTHTKSEKGNNGATPIMKPSIARPRRPSVEDLPADLYMEPLCPMVLRSPDGRKMPVYLLEKDIASPKDQDLDQEWSFWDLAQGERQDTTTITSRMTTASEITLASNLASVFADSGVSTRVQHHPLKMTEEDQDRDSNSHTDSDSDSDRHPTTRDTIAEKSCEEVGRDDNVESLPHTDEGIERILQHLERIEGSVKDLKARVDDAKLRIEQSEQEWGALPRDAEEPDRDQAAKVLPSLSPSLSSPVMEKMGRVASPELLYSWNKKLNPNLPKLAVKSVESELVMEERDLRYSPPMVESDVQDVLSFRLWEQKSSSAPKPKRRSRSSVSRAFEELDLETALDLVADEYAKSKDLKLPLPNSGLRRFRVRNSWDSVGKDDGGTDAASTEHVKSATKKLSPPNLDALLNLRTFDLRSRRAQPKVDVKVDVKGDAEEVRRCEEAESRQPEDFNPSPCSFTCGLSPTSLFSDDQEPFQMSVSSDENMFLKTFQPFSGGHAGSRRKSPRSVLSPEDEDPDEISHSTSDSSETREEDRQQNAANSCAYLYNDESSDLESPMKARNGGTTGGFAHQPFPTFTYNVGNEMGETSSSEEDLDDDASTTLGDASVADLGELEFFQDAANHLEPWLVKDSDGVLDDSDLEFLLSPDFKIKDITTSIVSLREGKTSPLNAREQQMIPCPASEECSEMVDQETMHESPKRPKSWVPYVTGELHGSDASPVRSPARGGSRRHGNASEGFVEGLPRAGGEKTIPQSRPPKRSVNFATDLVKEIPHSSGPTLEKKPAPPPLNPRARPNVKTHDDDEHVMSPSSAKTWDAGEEGPSIMTSRRRWRRNREQNATNSSGGFSRGGSSSWDARSESRRHRVAQVVPCAGRLFEWPHRLSFKVSSRGRGPLESDEESFAGDQSFGMSARRDAEQVRRILKGSQKKYSKLSVAEIMKEDFGKK